MSKIQNLRNLKLGLSRVILLCLIVSVLTCGIVYSTLPTQPFTINRGIYPGANTFTIWQEGTEYFAKNAYGIIQYSGTNASYVINSAINNNHFVFITTGIYTLTSPLSIAEISNLTIKGEGINNTILENCGIVKNDGTPASYITIEDLTIDIKNTVDQTAINLVGNLSNAVLRRVELKNTNNKFLLHWGTEEQPVNNLLVENCIFYDGGLTVSADNAAGDQDKATQYTTTFRNNLFIKENAVGGAMLTCGGSGNLLIDGNTFVDYSNNSYGAISLENYFGIIYNVTIINNKAAGFGKQGIAVGNYETRNGGKAIVTNNICEAIVVKGFEEAIVSNNIVTKGNYGIYFYNTSYVIVSNNVIRDTNIFNNPSYSDKGCIYAAYAQQLTITNNLMYDTLSQTPYGTRVSYTTTVWIHGNNFVGPFVYFNASDAGSNTNYLMHDNVVYGAYYENATT